MMMGTKQLENWPKVTGGDVHVQEVKVETEPVFALCLRCVT